MRRLGEGCLLWVIVLLLLFPSVVLLIVNEALHLLAVVLARLLDLASHAGSGSGSGTSPPATTVLPVGGPAAGAGAGTVIGHA